MKLAPLVGLAVLVLASCDGERGDTSVATPTSTSSTTATAPQRGDLPRRERLAYDELQELARTTCSAVPRDVLARSFADVSSDSVHGQDPAKFSDNGVALLYVEDIDIHPVPLQRAAYDGCVEGLGDHGRKGARPSE